MTQLIHVNQLVIRSNAKHNKRNPPLIIRGKTRNKKPTYAHEIELRLNDVVVGRFVYKPDAPLDCGAKVWFESDTLTLVPINKDGVNTDEHERNERSCPGE